MGISLNSREQLKLDIITRVLSDKILRKDAQKILGVSERTLRRYLRAFSTKGVLFAKHGNFGTAPKNKTDNNLRDQILGLIKIHYFDHNRTHALEQLSKHHGMIIGKDTFAKWCDEEEILLKRKRRHKKSAHYRRPRMKRKGLMLQMDGSPHRWFGFRKSCLVIAIDDADSEIVAGEFSPTETTLACMRVIMEVIRKRGLFHLLYVDRAGIFGSNNCHFLIKRGGFSQLKRALGELGIQVIYASCPEAKGRVERAFNTLQDRLPPEMRLKNITTIDKANEFFKNRFLPEMFNPRFKVQAIEEESEFYPVPADKNITEIFCLKQKRKIKNDHTITWGGKLYDLPKTGENWAGKNVEIRAYPDGTWKIFYNELEIEKNEVAAPLAA